VGPVVLGKTEAGSHVLSEQWLFLVLDILDEGIINSLVESFALDVNNSLLAFREKLMVSSLSFVVTGEVLVSDLVSVDTGEGNLGAGGDGVDLVDALKGNSVDLVGTGNKQEA